MQPVSFPGHRTNLTFFGDIIGDVAIAPHELGYEIKKHPSTQLSGTVLFTGPVVSPVLPDDGSIARVPGQDRRGLRGVDAWHEFMGIEATPAKFLRFASKYGLLGSTSRLGEVVNGTYVSCEPLVDWFYHYSKLRLLTMVFAYKKDQGDLAKLIEREQVSLRALMREQFGFEAKRSFAKTKKEEEQLPWWVQEHGFTGAMLERIFQPACWEFSRGSSKEELVREAFSQLSLEISNHSNIRVRHRGSRTGLDFGDLSNEEGIFDERAKYVITTTLEPTSLIGAMYIGVLLHACSYRTRKNLRQCDHCGANILNDHKLRKYCSNACKQKEKRARKERQK